MNTKKFFMLLAAVLLGSVSAMAQSGNNEPLKGDVNGDGKVDVGDITAVIKIMKENATQPTTYYWYVGPEQPTADNYTSLGEKVTEYNSSYQYTHVNSASNPNATQSRAYILIHNSKSVVSIIDNSTQLPVTFTDNYTNAPSITGYKVYRTAGLGAGMTFTINVH